MSETVNTNPTESAGERSATHDDMCERIEVDIGVGTQVSPCYCDYRSLERELTAARQRIEGLEREVEQIHEVCMNVADCPPIKVSDTFTVRYVKGMAQLINRFNKD